MIDWLNTTTNNNNYAAMLNAPHLKIIKVNGREGAMSIRMAPNSDVFLADETNSNLIWLAQTDGAGYLTVTPLDVQIHQTAPPVDINSFEQRIKDLEEKYERLNSGFSKQPKKQRRTGTESAMDSTS